MRHNLVSASNNNVHGLERAVPRINTLERQCLPSLLFDMVVCFSVFEMQCLDRLVRCHSSKDLVLLFQRPPKSNSLSGASNHVYNSSSYEI